MQFQRFIKITTFFTIMTLSFGAFADPRFVSDLTNKIKNDMAAQKLIPPSVIQGDINKKCDSLKSEIAPLLDEVNAFVGQSWTHQEDIDAAYNSVNGTPDQKIKPVLKYLSQARENMELDFKLRAEPLESKLETKIEMVKLFYEEYTNDLNRKRQSAVITNGEHCDMSLVDSDVRQAIRDANYLQLDSTGYDRIYLSDYFTLRPLPDKNGDTVKLAVDFLLDDKMLWCFSNLIAILEEAKGKIDKYQDDKDAAFDSMVDRFETLPDVERFKEKIALIADEINKKKEKETIKLLNAIPHKGMRNPMNDLTKRAEEILKIESLSRVDRQFDPGDGRRTSTELNEIIPKLRDLLEEGRKLHREMNFGTVIPAEIERIDEDVDDPRSGYDDWEAGSKQFRENVNDAVSDSIRARTKADGIKVIFERPNNWLPDWLENIGRPCLEWSNQDWNIYCELTGFANWEGYMEDAISRADAQVCAVTERELKDVPQFSGKIEIVPSLSVPAPKKVDK